MAQLLKQSTQQTILIGPLIDDGDFKSREASVAYDAAGIDVDIHKHAGAKTDVTLANSAGDGYWVHRANGHYSLTLSTSHTDTLGCLRVTWYATGVLPGWIDFEVVPAAIYDSLVGGSDKLPVDVQEISGDGTAADNLELAYDGTGYAGGTTKQSVAVDNIAAGAITAAAIATGAIDADAIAADAVTELQAGLATAAGLASLATAADLATVDGIVDAIKAKTDGLPASPAAVGSAMTLASGAVTAAVIAADAIDADAIKADAIAEIQVGLATASGLSGLATSAELASLATAADLATVDGIVDAIKVKTDGLPASPAAVGSAMTLAADAVTAAAIAADAVTEIQAGLATSAGLSGLATAANLATVDTVVDAIKAKTDALPASPAAVGSAMTLAADAVTAAAIAADAVTAIQAGLATSAGLSGLATASALATVDGIVDGIASDVAGLDGDAIPTPAAIAAEIVGTEIGFSGATDVTVAAALQAAWAQGAGSWALVGTTLTLYEPDGVTPVATLTIDDADAPTSRTRV